MLYLNSVGNATASKTEKRYAICHEKVPLMQNITELAPSKELLAQWQSEKIDWEDFWQRFIDEMRAEYRKDDKSRLKRLAKSGNERAGQSAREPIGDTQLTKVDRQRMEEIAAKCEFFSSGQPRSRRRTCQVCKHLDQQAYMCPMTRQVVIHYEWTTLLRFGPQA